MMSIYNRERIKSSAFIYNMRSFMHIYDFIGERLTDYIMWLREFVSIS